MVVIRAGDRMANVRRRLLLGEYDSDHVVNEVARRMLARGVFEEREQPQSPQRYH